MSVPLIPAVDYLEAVAVLTACRQNRPFYRDRSQSSEAVYVSIRRGGAWFGVRIVAHEPAYVCSADYEQVIVPLAVADLATLARAERQVVQAVRHGGRVVADPAEINAALDEARRENGLRFGVADVSNREACAIRHRLHFRARWTHDEQRSRL